MKRNLLILSMLLNLCFLLAMVWLFRDKIEKLFVKEYKIVFFGDSITSNGNWRALTNRRDVKNSGYPGFTSSHLVWLLKDGVIRYKPDTCYIMVGVNDIGVGMPLHRTFQNYTEITDSLLAYNITPIIQSTLLTTSTAINSKVDSLNTLLKGLSRLRKIKYMDLNQYISDGKKIRAEYTTDGTHLSESGYLEWKKHL